MAEVPSGRLSMAEIAASGIRLTSLPQQDVTVPPAVSGIQQPDQTAPTTTTSADHHISRSWTVKQLLSGDAVVLRDAPRNGPPNEMTVYLSNVSAPRIGKRPAEPTDVVPPDEPYAWESREYMRQKLIGKDVNFICDFKATSGRGHGRIFLGNENVTESGVRDGWLEVRQGTKGTDEYTQKLNELQDQAKTAKRGKWAAEEDAKEHIRDIKWTVDNPRNFVDQLKQKPQKAIIEQVRDGSTLRAFLLPDFYYVTVMLSGVKAPIVRMGAEGKVVESDPFGEEARFFTEHRLLQRDVQIVLEGVANQNFVGSVIHPKGNISESLLKQGLAKCVDWSIAIASCGSEILRAAEREAKEKRLRLWQSYVPPNKLSADSTSFQAKVIEVGLGDNLVVQKENGDELKIYLSSIIPPRAKDAKEEKTSGARPRPLYDVPFMFEAREFLRRRLIGKKVSVTVDYMRPRTDAFSERTSCTVMAGQQNVAEALVSKGLARVMRHRQDDDNRSVHYDSLLAAEAKAEKSKKALHVDKDSNNRNLGIVRIQELTDAQRSKPYVSQLSRAGRTDALVEFVSSGSRLRVFVPRETCLMQFLLSGISCPRSARIGLNLDADITSGDPFGDEALKFTKSKCFQRDVEVEVETIDKGGSFIGYMFVKDGEHSTMQNLSVMLVDQGLAKVHNTADRSPYYNELLDAQNRAKQRRLNLWANYEEESEPTDEKEQNDQEKVERRLDYRHVIVTDVEDSLKFYVQNYDQGAKLEEMMKELRAEFALKPPMTSAYTARRGDMCAALFVDGQWYRAKVESVKGAKIDVHYVDFGNRETTEGSKLAALPPIYHQMPPGAHQYSLALIKLTDNEYEAAHAVSAFKELAFRAKRLLLNEEYRPDFVTLLAEDEGQRVDLAKTLLEQGYVLYADNKSPRLKQLATEYAEAEEKAKRERAFIWQYGDFTGSDI